MGHLRIFKEYDSTVAWFGEVTQVVVISASVIRLTVNSIQYNTSFAFDDNVVLSFAAKGEPGNDGVDATPGSDCRVVDVIANLPTSNNPGNVDQLEAEIEVPADLLSGNKDILEFSLTVETFGAVMNFLMSYGNNGYISDNTEGIFADQFKEVRIVKIEGKIYRLSSSTANIEIEVNSTRKNPSLNFSAIGPSDVTGFPEYYTFTRVSFPVLHSDLNKLQFVTQNTVSGDSKVIDFMVKYTKHYQ
jgi:hypothetical protein